MKAEVEAYRKFKDLCERLVGLSIELSKLKSAPVPLPTNPDRPSIPQGTLHKVEMRTKFHEGAIMSCIPREFVG